MRATPGGAFGAMLVFMAVMFILGFFLDTFEIIFIMLPIFGPPLLKLGYDPVWLGVMVGINLQTSFLTPPFGATLFYMRGVAPPRSPPPTSGSARSRWTWLQLAGLARVWAVPALATWLPARSSADRRAGVWRVTLAGASRLAASRRRRARGGRG